MGISFSDIVTFAFIWAMAFYTGMTTEDRTALDLSRSDGERRILQTMHSTVVYFVVLLVLYGLVSLI